MSCNWCWSRTETRSVVACGLYKKRTTVKKKVEVARSLVPRLIVQHASHTLATQLASTSFTVIAITCSYRLLCLYHSPGHHTNIDCIYWPTNNALMSCVCRQLQLQFMTWTSASLLKHHPAFCSAVVFYSKPEPQMCHKSQRPDINGAL